MRIVRVGVGALLVCAALSGPAAGVANGAGSVPVLLRDNQASIDALVGEQGACPVVSPPDGCFQNDTQAEPAIAVDPTNPDHAVAAFHVGRANDGGAAADGYAVTFDQGRTWRQGLFPGLTIATGGTVQRVSDPRVAFAPDGRHVYATAQPYNNDVVPAYSSVVSMTSADGGLTWARPVVVVSDSFSQNYPQSDAYLLNHGFDQPDLTVDHGAASGHHLGRIYLTWVRLTLDDFAYGAYSDDGGAHWNLGPSVSGVLPQGFVIYHGNVPLYPRPVVLANGDLAVMGWNANASAAPPPNYFGAPGPVVSDPTLLSVTQNQTGAYQLYRAAGAGGVSWPTPLVFSPVGSTVAYLANNVLRGQRSAEKQPLFAVDPVTGRFYAAWTDARFRTDAANDILLTYSDDQGATWRYPQKVNPGGPADNVNHWCAMLDAGTDGVLRVGYRQRVEAAQPNPDFSNFSRSVDTFYVESRDRGVTFGAPLKVNTLASDMRFGAFDGGQTNVGQGGVFLGDYDAMASNGGGAYLVRAEPVSVRAGEAATYPPIVHHQRTWVAVVGEVAGASVSVSPSPSPVGGGGGTPNTGTGTAGLVALCLVALMLGTGLWRVRGRD
ncbi:MAG: sialidase family protein [Candidatus Dormibacteria bacterium]